MHTRRSGAAGRERHGLGPAKEAGPGVACSLLAHSMHSTPRCTSQAEQNAALSPTPPHAVLHRKDGCAGCGGTFGGEWIARRAVNHSHDVQLEWADGTCTWHQGRCPAIKAGFMQKRLSCKLGERGPLLQHKGLARMHSSSTGCKIVLAPVSSSRQWAWQTQLHRTIHDVLAHRVPADGS